MKIEFYVCVDDDGDYAVGDDEGGALEQYDDNIGNNNAKRLIKIELDVPFAAVPTLVGVVPAEGQASLNVKPI